MSQGGPDDRTAPGIVLSTSTEFLSTLPSKGLLAVNDFRERGNRRFQVGDYVAAYRCYSDGLQQLSLIDERGEQQTGKKWIVPGKSKNVIGSRTLKIDHNTWNKRFPSPYDMK